jgi:hypothetical protein
MVMIKRNSYIGSFFRCVITYNDISSVRVLHYAVSCDYVDNFVSMIKDTFVHPDIAFTDIIFSYDSRDYFQLV